ncbi:MAG: hypothetical protein O3A13_08330 [Proteobacteria bacterium]|nr:hypothetical protein [Pseudomonadota bacterium]MDA0993626.1 hypothetical protein [Pseudomonadota bacterium]
MNQKKSIRLPLRARIAPAILRRAKWIGFTIDPFITVSEGESACDSKSTAYEFEYRFITRDEIPLLVNFSPNGGLKKMQSAWDDGKKCYTAWDGQRLAAKMWCDFREYNFRPNYRLLEDDEVYLYAAHTHPDYRGSNLAPELRLRCYDSLRKLGRTRFYSVTVYYNSAARRFKEKIGARNELLRLHISLFGRWSKTITLKKY